MKKLSGSSGRSLLLLITNITLMVLGAITVASGSILIAIFLLHLFTFASQLFLVVPVFLITSGTLTIIVAIFGLSLFKRKNEQSGVFLAYASIILVALLISLTASVTSFVLRETIAHRFSKTDVTAQLNGYATDPFLRSRWDTIQKEFRCCGGYNVGTGYTDWEGVSIEPLPIGANPAALVTGSGNGRSPLRVTLDQVPDSCCIKSRLGCGKKVFEEDANPGTISQKIWVNGCMTEARQTLFKHVMPLLLICALVSLVVGLIELLLLLCAVCFADHIKRLSSIDGSSTIGRSSSLSQEKQGIIQDTGEAYLSHEEKQLEYGLDNANPGYGFNGEELIGNEDDSESWYNSSTTDSRIRHQLPLLDGSPSLRKNRFFGFQGSQGSLGNGGYELQNNQDPESGAGPESMGGKGGQTGEDSIKTRPDSSAASQVPPRFNGMFGLFMGLFGKQGKEDTTARQNQVSLREDALDREATLMNVLKSVTANRSEPDLIEAGKVENERKSSGFSFFGMRSKSKENVIDTNPDDNAEEVKKLPTLDDKTIDKNKKFAPMENLTDAGNRPKRSGLARLKRIRDEMFKKKHQTLKEEDAKEEAAATEILDNAIAVGEASAVDTDKKDEDLNFDEQKKKDDKEEATTQSSNESSNERTQSESETDRNEDKVERKNSKKDQDLDKTTKVERKLSTRSVHYEEDQTKPQFKSGIPIRGSTFVRQNSEESQQRSISPNEQSRVRVSGFGVTPQTNPRHQRTLSMSSTHTPTLNTIHEPVQPPLQKNVRVRHPSLQIAGNIPIDGIDDEVDQLNRAAAQPGTYVVARKTTSPGPYNRSMSPQHSQYYMANQQATSQKLSRMQTLARSEEQLHNAPAPPVMVEYLRPVGILTSNSPPPTLSRPTSALGQSRDNSQDGHVTKIKIQDNEKEADSKSLRGRERSDSRSRKKKDSDSRSRERSDSRKKSKSSSSKDKEDKKRQKQSSSKKSKSRKSRSRSRSVTSGSGSSDSNSDSDSRSDSSESSASDSDKDKKNRKKSKRSSRDKDRKSSSRKESKSKHRKKSKRHRSEDSSPDKKHRKSTKSSEKSSDKSSRKTTTSKRSERSPPRIKEEKVLESNASPAREQLQRPRSGLALPYDHDYMNIQQQEQRALSPYDTQGGYVVDDPRVGYYSTSTLPSAAQLRKSSGYQMVPVQQGPPGSRAISEPRAAKQKLVAATSTLDRYTLMAANQARAKSADRAQMKYRRVSLDPTYHQGYPGQQPTQAAPQNPRVRSVSMATQEAGDIHVYNNSQIPTPNQVYRTTVEMEPHTGELYTVQQGPGGGVRMAKSSRVRDDVYAGRRPTHIAEASPFHF